MAIGTRGRAEKEFCNKFRRINTTSRFRPSCSLGGTAPAEITQSRGCHTTKVKQKQHAESYGDKYPCVHDVDPLSSNHFVSVLGASSRLIVRATSSYEEPILGSQTSKAHTLLKTTALAERISELVPVSLCIADSRRALGKTLHPYSLKATNLNPEPL